MDVQEGSKDAKQGCILFRGVTWCSGGYMLFRGIIYECSGVLYDEGKNNRMAV